MFAGLLVRTGFDLVATRLLCDMVKRAIAQLSVHYTFFFFVLVIETLIGRTRTG